MAANDASDFGDLLRTRRHAANLTQEALAEGAGVSVRAITDLERGVIRAPRRDTLNMLATALNLSSDERQEWDELRRRLSTRQTRGEQSDRLITSHLPSQPNRLLGREREIAALINVLRQPDVRLVTITGSGGVGKTRVALHVGHELAHSFADGVQFIELAAVREPALLLPAIARELGMREGGETAIRERLKRHLSRHEMLLILDNVEQLRDAAADLGDLIADATGVKFLIASRAGLSLRAEHEFPIWPLPIPEWQSEGEGEVGRLESNPAISLFVQRSRQVIPDFTLTSENAATISAICARLDGLPLAIELAAARVRVLSPDEMLARLNDRLALLTGGSPDAPDRHRTMRAAIAWSYDLLSPQEQRFFRALAVFSGGWTLEGGEALVPEGLDPLAGLESLARGNLIHQTSDAADRSRFGMLETVREFGLEQLEEAGEAADARRRHCLYYLHLAERAEPELKGPDQGDWLARLGAEMANLRSALEWSTGTDVDPEIGQRLGGSLSWFWEGRGYVSEGRQWLTRALEREPSDPVVRMRALGGAGWLAHIQNDPVAARQLLNESLRTAREVGDQWTVAWTLHLLGRVAYFDADAEGARALGEQSLELAHEINDRWIIAWAWHLLGLAAHINGDVANAREYYEQSLAIRHEIEYPEGIGTVTGLLGMLALREGDFERALTLTIRSLETNRALGARWLVINMIASVVMIAAAYDDPPRAARLAGFVDAMSEAVGASPIPIQEAGFQQSLDSARDRLDAGMFDQFWAEGRAMSMDEAIDDALALGDRLT